MEFLRKPIHELTFEDVSTFCEQSVSEGIQLDYKKELSAKGLSKHFAAFSNARGGLIIIGVQENSLNGKPITWDGVDPDGKLEDRIHQYAANVDPLPLYEVHCTNPNESGKVFLLIRIFEGDRTPYYVINDANIHMRTGNITKQCIELASPQETARLFEKRQNAEFSQEINIEKAERIYKHVIGRFHKQEKRFHKANLQSTPYRQELAAVPEIGVFTTLIQPQFPNKSLVSIPELREIIESINKERNINWLCSQLFETIQEGILMTKSNTEHHPTFTACQEILASGLIFGRKSIASQSLDSQTPPISTQRIMEETHSFFKTARKIYAALKYQGGLIGHLEISGLNDAHIIYFGVDSYAQDAHDILLPSYRWEFETDTSKLFNDKDLKDFLVELVSEIIWSFGWTDFNQEHLISYINDKKWLTS